MSAIATLSMKCSGLLLRSSFAILAARARHLFSSAPTPAFSVPSRSSKSSSIYAPTVSGPPLGPRWSPVERSGFKLVPPVLLRSSDRYHSFGGPREDRPTEASVREPAPIHDDESFARRQE